MCIALKIGCTWGTGVSEDGAVALSVCVAVGSAGEGKTDGVSFAAVTDGVVATVCVGSGRLVAQALSKSNKTTTQPLFKEYITPS
jgi:hypothetical protein